MNSDNGAVDQPEGDPRESESRFYATNKTCLRAVDLLSGFDGGKHDVRSGIAIGDATWILEDLESIASCARNIVSRMRHLHADFRAFAYKQRWEFEFFGRIEPGAHFAMAYFLDQYFVRSLNAHHMYGIPLDDERPDLHEQSTPPAGALQHEEVATLLRSVVGPGGLARIAARASSSCDRLRFLLEREAFEFEGIVPAGASGGIFLIADDVMRKAGISPTVEAIELNHRVRRMRIVGSESRSVVLRPRQMEFVLICALAKKKNEWAQTNDFKKQAAIGNPSGVFSRLPPEVKKFIETNSSGRRLICDARIIDPEVLESGRRIDWDTLEVVESRNRDPRK